MISTWMRDLRFGARMLAKAPGFAAVAVATLALGIGANTAIFSAVYAALLRPLPYRQPDRLITLTQGRRQNAVQPDEEHRSWNASYPDYLDWVKQSKTFAALGGSAGDGFLYGGRGQPQLLDAAQVTVNFFSLLGVRPMLGRDFAAGEDVPKNPKVAILSYGFWQSQFGGARGVLGRSIQLDGIAVTIIGVLPGNFEFASAGDVALWVPLHLSPDLATRRNLRWFRVLGRLAPGASIAQAQAEMNSITKRLAAAYPQEDGATITYLLPLRDRIVGQVQPLLWLLFGAVGFVLLVACLNVANLLLVRTAGRRREFAIRTALGASRGNLVRQLLVESMLLAAAGGALGFVLAQQGVRLLVTAIPPRLLETTPFLRDARPNLAVLAFLGGVAVLTGIVFGLAPALECSRAQVGDALREEARASTGGGRRRLRDALVVAEIAICLVLLAGAGLMVRSLGALLHRNPGFDSTHLLQFGVYLPPTQYAKEADIVRFDQQFTTRLRALPGVESAAGGRVLPLTGGGGSIRFVIEGRPVAVGHEDECDVNDAAPGYFAMLKIPLFAGREFNDATDNLTGPGHLIVNRAFVDRYFGGENPIGKRLRFTYSAKNPFQDIVGVVGNAPDDLDGAMPPVIYTALRHSPGNFITYGARTSQDPASLAAAVRGLLHDVDPQLPLYRPATMEQVVARSPSVFLRRYPSLLIGSFAGLALLLALVGLYGLLSYSVSQRTREIGIRMALGARGSEVMRLVLRQGTRLAIAGVALGVAAGLGLTRLMSNLLYGVTARDPETFAAAAVLLALAAIAACYVPARRATRVDPIVALRHE